MGITFGDLLGDPSLAAKYFRENKSHIDVLRAFVANHQYRLAKTYRRWRADPTQICMIVDAETHPEMVSPEDEGRSVSIQLSSITRYKETPFYNVLRECTDKRIAGVATTMVTMVVFRGMTLLTLIQKDGTREPTPIDAEFLD